MDLPVVFLENSFDNRAVVEVIEWQEFVELITMGHEIRDTGDPDRDKNGAAFQLCTYRPPAEAVELTADGYTRRSRSNVLEYYALHLDFDDGTTVEQAKIRFAEFEHVGYTSYNHLRKPGVEKFRVILPLAEPIDVPNLLARRADILSWLETADESTLAIARLFYLPATSNTGSMNAQSWYNKGELIDAMWFVEEPLYIPPAPTKLIATDEGFKTKLLEALSTCSFTQEPDWFKLGAALHASGFSLSDWQRLSWPDAGTQRKCSSRWKDWDQHAPPMNQGWLVNRVRQEQPDFMRSRVKDARAEAVLRLKRKNK